MQLFAIKPRAAHPKFFVPLVPFCGKNAKALFVAQLVPGEEVILHHGLNHFPRSKLGLPSYGA